MPAQVRPEVQEWRLYQGVCEHCRKTHASVLPAGVPRGQLGPRALAPVGLLAQTMGVNFSVGAISQAHALVSQILQAPVALAAQTLAYAPVVHMDEAGYPREGRRSSWAWAPEFVRWSNVEHRHSGILYVSPAQCHAGHDRAILAARHTLYLQARQRHPARCVVLPQHARCLLLCAGFVLADRCADTRAPCRPSSPSPYRFSR